MDLLESWGILGGLECGAGAMRMPAAIAVELGQKQMKNLNSSQKGQSITNTAASRL